MKLKATILLIIAVAGVSCNCCCYDDPCYYDPYYADSCATSDTTETTPSN